MKEVCHGAGARFVARQSVGVRSASNSDPQTLEFDLTGIDGPVVINASAGDEDGRVSLTLRHDAENGVSADYRADVATFLAAHESTLRGCGFFHRLLPALDDHLLPDEDALSALATAMRLEKRSIEHSTIPAAYTYLGQFLAHDLAYTSSDSDPLNPVNYRTQAFDLDSIFDARPDGYPENGKAYLCRGGLGLGATSAGRFADIPRDAEGVPLLPDERNDNNVIVSQLVASIIRFHHRICDIEPDEAAAKRLTRRHMQSVILHDYLERIIDRDIYDEVMTHGRGFLFADAPPFPFRIPVEFSIGCFRFGHSMVRERYFLNGILSREPTRQVLAHTHLGRVIDRDRPFLQDRWVIDWSYLLDLDGSREPEYAEAIDAKLPVLFQELDRRWVYEMPRSQTSNTVPLSELTLKRGRSVGLSPAQDLVECVNTEMAGHPLSDGAQRKRVKGIADLSDNAFGAALGDVLSRDDHRLAKATPLWFYTLAEAQKLGRDPRDGSTRLGPLASRIVMETVHAAIQASPDSIIDDAQRVRFSPHSQLVAARENAFTLHDIFRNIGNLN